MQDLLGGVLSLRLVLGELKKTPLAKDLSFLKKMKKEECIHDYQFKLDQHRSCPHRPGSTRCSGAAVALREPQHTRPGRLLCGQVCSHCTGWPTALVAGLWPGYNQSTTSYHESTMVHLFNQTNMGAPPSPSPWYPQAAGTNSGTLQHKCIQASIMSRLQSVRPPHQTNNQQVANLSQLRAPQASTTSTPGGASCVTGCSQLRCLCQTQASQHTSVCPQLNTPHTITPTQRPGSHPSRRRPPHLGCCSTWVQWMSRPHTQGTH